MKIQFEHVHGSQVPILRSKTPTGWLVLLGQSCCHVEDPEHEWLNTFPPPAEPSKIFDDRKATSFAMEVAGDAYNRAWPYIRNSLSAFKRHNPQLSDEELAVGWYNKVLAKPQANKLTNFRPKDLMT